MPKAVPVDYQSTVKKPEDFDAFWDGVQQQVAAVPLEPEIIPDSFRTSEDVEVFQVFYTQPRARAHRRLVLPPNP